MTGLDPFWSKVDIGGPIDQAAGASQSRVLLEDEIVREAIALNVIAPFRQAISAMSSEDEVRDKLERRRAIYLKKRNLFNALAESTETPWERYDFAAEVVEWVAGDLGIKLSERDDEALTPNPCGQGDGGALVSGD